MNIGIPRINITVPKKNREGEAYANQLLSTTVVVVPNTTALPATSATNKMYAAVSTLTKRGFRIYLSLSTSIGLAQNLQYTGLRRIYQASVIQSKQ